MLGTARLHDWIDALLLAVSPRDACVVLAVLVVISLSKFAGMWMYALVALPGTLAHELVHFAVAMLLGARPSFPSLVPQRIGRRWRLGAVAFRVGRLRALPIALAPLALLPLALWWAAAFLRTPSWPLYCLNVWIVAALLGASLPSRTDWQLALPALLALAGLLTFCALVWWWLR